MTEALPAAIEAIPDGGDPFIVGVKWFGLVVAALLVGAAPVMLYLRKYHVDHVANSRDAATAEVYETLRQQIRDHGDQIHRLNEERSRQESDTSALRARIVELEVTEGLFQRVKAQLEETEVINQRLKDKLDRKDSSIEQLSAENRRLLTEILHLKDRVHELELRLAKDEAAWCPTCDRYGKEECQRVRFSAVPVEPAPAA